MVGKESSRTNELKQRKLHQEATPRALKLQTGLFVQENSLITYEDAKKFLEQTVVQGDAIQLSQVMREEPCNALETRILTDDTLTNFTEQEINKWRQLPIKTIADLVTKYFGHRPDTGETLTQSFDKAVFQFSYEDYNLEIQTMQEYTTVARAFAQEREIKPSQQKDLVKLI